MELIISGSPYLYEGALGLAPQWATGSCNQACQEWVSACVLARVNAYGEPIQISLRGDNRALSVTASERSAFNVREGAYFGNIFAEPMQLLTCDDPGTSTQGVYCYGEEWMCHNGEYELRRCSEDPASCGMTSVGSCASLCSDRNGTYRDCKALGRTWPGSMNVYLRPIWSNLM
jgi:hypothetical protein